MADYYVSLTMALPKDEIPARLTALDDLALIYKAGQALDTYSRKNWLIYAVERCASHYGFPRLSYLSQAASVLDSTEARLVAQEIDGLLKAIEQDPASLAKLLGQDAWSDREIRAMLKVDASPWGPLVETDDGDELPYVLSFLAAQLALLRHAIARNWYVAFAQTSPDTY